MIRILVAEDSSTVRELLVEILGRVSDFEVVGEANNGIEAVEMTKRLKPDVVTMDIQMPRLDGFEATKQIMNEAPTPIVIVSGLVNTREIRVSMQALRAGAVAVLPKLRWPDTPGFEDEHEQLVETVRAMAQVKVIRHWPSLPTYEKPPPPKLPEAYNGARGRVVAVAASTGGPAALNQILANLPGGFPAPILVCQHIASGFTEGLTAWLSSISSLRVKVAEHGEPLSPWTVYIAPEDRHLGVSDRSTVALSDAAPIDHFRPSATYMFESVAKAFRTSTVAVMLTGMGRDGIEGLKAVHEAGGRIVVQDEESSVVFGMPGAAIAAGLGDAVLPLHAIPARLMEVM